MENDYKIKNILSLYCEPTYEKFYHIVIIFEDEQCRTYKLDIPNFEFNVSIIKTFSFHDVFNYYFLRFNDGKMIPMNNICFTIQDITEYHEMTLREIEQELGYKIKIKE